MLTLTAEADSGPMDKSEWKERHDPGDKEGTLWSR